MKITFRLLPPFTRWASTDTVELQFEPGETLGQIADKWMDANPDKKEVFTKFNAYIDGHLYAMYMRDHIFYKEDYTPEDDMLFTMMSTMIGG